MNSPGYQRMLELIFNIPEQFEQAEKIGWGCRIKNLQEVKNIVVVGVGGSAITGDVIRTIFLQESSLPVLVWRDYYLPAAVTKRTLLFVISYSGNTEETLTAYQEAKRRGSQIVVITSGGKLAERARSDGFEILVVPAGMPPRSALGLLTISMLTALNRLGLCR
ncbi:MAG: SIS domain-containing protein, partial [bacterium]